MNKILKKKKRVFVGLSGGVDSAVAAALLKKQGYDVAGVFMRLWKPRISADSKTADGRGRENSCCSVESEAKARLVASKLQIPFYIFNFAKEFKREVVDYFLAELAAGRTPNPCAVCNPKIKFGLFLERAKKLGADYISTGHYARVKSIPDVILRAKPEGSLAHASRHSSEILPPPPRGQNDKKVLFKLFAAKDKIKDQSYFLAALIQEQLKHVIFPLGNYRKDEVYALAKKWRLPHQPRQSFDVCFAGDYQGFLKKYLKMREGKILNLLNLPLRKRGDNLPTPLCVRGAKEIRSWAKGAAAFTPLVKGGAGGLKHVSEKVLGQHQGLPLYTIGQRASVGGPGPFYVVGKDVKDNILYVSNNERDLHKKEISVGKVNWIAGKEPKLPLKCKVKIRYGGEAAEADINQQSTPKNPTDSTGQAINPPATPKRSFGGRGNQQLKIQFKCPQRAITPGQIAVFYGRGGEMLGGGIIQR